MVDQDIKNIVNTGFFRKKKKRSKFLHTTPTRIYTTENGPYLPINYKQCKETNVG